MRVGVTILLIFCQDTQCLRDWCLLELLKPLQGTSKSLDKLSVRLVAAPASGEFMSIPLGWRISGVSLTSVDQSCRGCAAAKLWVAGVRRCSEGLSCIGSIIWLIPTVSLKGSF